jgi:hypothetical protein
MMCRLVWGDRVVWRTAPRSTDRQWGQEWRDTPCGRTTSTNCLFVHV